MPETEKLDSWKAIAAYVNRDVRTAQRWHSKEGMPIHHVAGKGISVFAWTHEIDKWQYGSRTKLLGRWILVGATLAVLLIMFVIFLIKKNSRESKDLKLLHYEIRSRPPGSIINIYNEANQLALYLLVPSHDYSKNKGRVSSLWIGDINEDKRDDVVFIDRKNTKLFLFEQNEDGICFEKNSWSLSNQFYFQGKHYEVFLSKWVDCADLTGDGLPEIITLSYHSIFFPSSCQVYDREGRLLYQIWHPGVLNNTLVSDRDKDGIAELTITGTNNFIVEGESSGPIFFNIQRDWSKIGVLDLFGEGRRLATAVPQGTRLFYVYLKKDTISNNISTWETAGILGLRGDRIHIKAGWLHDDYLRHFVFDLKFNCREAFISANLAKPLGINVTEYERAGLLKPVYWNGTSWQTEVCLMSQSP